MSPTRESYEANPRQVRSRRSPDHRAQVKERWRNIIGATARYPSPGSWLDFFPYDILDISPVNEGIDLSVLPAPEPNATFNAGFFERLVAGARSMEPLATALMIGVQVAAALLATPACPSRNSRPAPRLAGPNSGRIVGDFSRTRMGPMEEWRGARPEVQLWNSR